MVDLKTMAATTEETGTLGSLVWYTIAEQLIQRDELRTKLLNAGLDEGFMPREIRLPDAFRRATSAVERKKDIPDSGITINYLIKEVSSDKDSILRYIVRETRDSKGKRLSYKAKTAQLEFDKKTGLMSCQADAGSVEEEICKEAEALYRIYQTHHDSRSIRGMVYGILSSMSPTPVRPSGGVYFIPKAYEESLRKLVNFLQSLNENTEGFMVPVINTQENKDMIRKKLNDHIKQVMRNLAEGLKDPSLGKSKGNPLLEDAKQVLDGFNEYQQALGEELMDMKYSIELIQAQMKSMLDKLSA